ncbi:ras-related protein Rab-31 [Tupaia chinensis]|uniref:ras-related protein Rab-31 n=1 Tax=Tupaia chinensis TaxID=246437 RepID=UPI000FFCA635|nr:ras-related protein Rab-31 [Tupaia chinensis]
MKKSWTVPLSSPLQMGCCVDQAGYGIIVPQFSGSCMDGKDLLIQTKRTELYFEALDTGVGKSSIVCRFVQDHFDHNISPTIGASFMTKTVPCGNELHKFLIWDTAGQERFHSLAPMYYRGSAAAVIVYDITKQDSFHTLKKWVKELKEHGPENIVMAIAGNKCDLSDIREVPLKDAKEYAESIGAIVVETSAKNAINIEELFQGISRQIPPLDPHENGNNGAIKLGKQTAPGSRRCC